jgi:hypothetical protein
MMLEYTAPTSVWNISIKRLGYGLDDWGFESLQDQKISLYSTVSRMGLGLGALYRYSSSAELKNGGDIPPLPHTS